MSNLQNVFIYFSFLLISKNIFGLTQCGIYHNERLEQKARNGHEIFHEDLPSVCKFKSVINSQTKVCGGNFISKNDVLTSVTCIKDILRGKIIKISLAESKRHIGDYFSEMSIAKVMNHPDFNEETMENNIAIVRLQIPEYISNFIHPICIPENDADMLELKSVLVGPGKNGSLSMTTIFPKSFLAAMIDIQDTNCCKHHPLRPRNFVVNDKNICTGSRGKGSSEGDTGSPLLVNSYGSWYQIGIVSFGMGSNQEIENQDVYPSVYTRISKHCDFIESVSEARCQKIGSLSSLFSKATSYMKQKKCPYAKFQALLNASSAENKHLSFLIMTSLILSFIHVCTYM